MAKAKAEDTKAVDGVTQEDTQVEAKVVNLEGVQPKSTIELPDGTVITHY